MDKLLRKYDIGGYLPLVLIAVVLFVALKLGKALFAIPKMVYDNTLGKVFQNSQTEEVQNEIVKELKKDAEVTKKVNTGALSKADSIHNAIASFGYDIKELNRIFKSIDSKEEMKAIYLAYGQRGVWYTLGMSKDNLKNRIINRLYGYQLDANLLDVPAQRSIRQTLAWIEQ